MGVILIRKELHSKGEILTFGKEGEEILVLFLTHAVDRMKKWALSPEQVGQALLEADEVLLGHHGRFIAHKCCGRHIVRAVYQYENLMPVLVTVYFPLKDRYYKGGGKFEDKILS